MLLSPRALLSAGLSILIGFWGLWKAREEGPPFLVLGVRHACEAQSSPALGPPQRGWAVPWDCQVSPGTGWGPGGLGRSPRLPRRACRTWPSPGATSIHPPPLRVAPALLCPPCWEALLSSPRRDGAVAADLLGVTLRPPARHTHPSSTTLHLCLCVARRGLEHSGQPTHACRVRESHGNLLCRRAVGDGAAGKGATSLSGREGRSKCRTRTCVCAHGCWGRCGPAPGLPEGTQLSQARLVRTWPCPCRCSQASPLGPSVVRASL